MDEHGAGARCRTAGWTAGRRQRRPRAGGRVERPGVTEVGTARRAPEQPHPAVAAVVDERMAAARRRLRPRRLQPPPGGRAVERELPHVVAVLRVETSEDEQPAPDRVVDRLGRATRRRRCAARRAVAQPLPARLGARRERPHPVRGRDPVPAAEHEQPPGAAVECGRAAAKRRRGPRRVAARDQTPARRRAADADPPDVGEVRAPTLPAPAEDEPVAARVVERRTGSEAALGPLQSVAGRCLRRGGLGRERRRRRSREETGREEHADQDQSTSEGDRSHDRLTTNGVALFRG